jgi:23S rRNA maturation-related 3'-5' exoribonuclease YhaM
MVSKKHAERYNLIGSYLLKVREEKYKDPLVKMHKTCKNHYVSVPASCKRHHKWAGGYLDHIFEVMELSLRFFKVITVELKTNVDFTYDDVVLVSYIHDINKITRYEHTSDDWKIKRGQYFDFKEGTGNCDESAEVVCICSKFGLLLEQKHLEAISHHHGGFSNSLASMYRYPGTLTALSSLIHSADLLSQYLYGGEKPVS